MALADFKIHEWLLNEGSGEIAADILGGRDVVPVPGDSIPWGKGDVFGQNRSFLTLGWSFYTSTTNLMFGCLVNNAGISGNLTQWTVCFIGRSMINLSVTAFWGAFLTVGSALFRTWNGNIDRNGVIFYPGANVKWGEWAKYVITCDGVNVRAYVNDMSNAVTTTAAFSLTTGSIRMNSFADSTNPGSMELANVTICNAALNEADRTEYCNQFGSVQSRFCFSKFQTDDFGGFLQWPEEDADTHDRSYVEVVEFEGRNVYKMSADYASGGSCQAAVVRRIKPGMTEFYKRMRIYLPSDFDCNWTFGQTFNVFSLWTDRPNAGADIFAFQLQQTSEGTGPLYLYRLYYRNTTGQSNISLGGAEFTKGVWHDVYFYANISTGQLVLILDGVELVNEIVNLDISPNFEYNGIYLGIHPQNAGNYYYMEKLHIGEIDFNICGNKAAGLVSRERLVSL